jgi:DNA-binding LytR/AlgR family response regulator
VRLALTSVEWFEAERDYVRIHADGGEHLIRQAVHALEDRLDPKRFLRVHRSAVVNVDRIERVERKVNGALTIRLMSGCRVPVGRSYADAVRALISGASVGAGRAPRRS